MCACAWTLPFCEIVYTHACSLGNAPINDGHRVQRHDCHDIIGLGVREHLHQLPTGTVADQHVWARLFQQPHHSHGLTREAVGCARQQAALHDAQVLNLSLEREEGTSLAHDWAGRRSACAFAGTLRSFGLHNVQAHQIIRQGRMRDACVVQERACDQAWPAREYPHTRKRGASCSASGAMAMYELPAPCSSQIVKFAPAVRSPAAWRLSVRAGTG